jgi:hypothetical protein
LPGTWMRVIPKRLISRRNPELKSQCLEYARAFNLEMK